MKQKTVFTRKFYIYLILTLLFAALIFFFSAQNGEESTETSNIVVLAAMEFLDAILPAGSEADITLLIRKLAHFTEYLIFALFLTLTFREYRRSAGRALLLSWRTLLLCLIIAALYAMSDELHQYFVPGRAGQITDVCIDSTGAAVGILFVWIHSLHSRKHSKQYR